LFLGVVACTQASAACFSSSSSPGPKDAGDVDAPGLDATVPETGSEAGPDAPAEAMPDVASDVAGEAAIDAALDAGADAVADVAADSTAPADAAADTGEAGIAPGTTLWFRTAVSTGDAGVFSSADSLAADTMGNVYASVRFRGTIDFGNGQVDAAPSSSAGDVEILKYDPAGTLVWATHFSGNLQTDGMGVDSQGGVGLLIESYGGSSDFGTGAKTGAVFAVKLDASGHTSWVQSYATKFFVGAWTWPQNAQGVAVSAAGDVAFAGELYQAVDFGAGSVPLTGSTDAFAVALDPSGNLRFAHHWGTASAYAVANGVAFASNGDVLIAGMLDAYSFDLGGGSLPAIGVADSYGNADGFVLRLNTSGAYVWAKRFGGAGASTTATMITSTGSGFALGGTFTGGSLDWGGSSVVATGTDAGAGPMLFAAGLDTGGAYVWSHVYGDPTDGNLQFGGIGATAAGNPVVSGTFGKAIDLGDHAISASSDTGTAKAFVAELAASDGSCVFSRASNAGTPATGTTYGAAASAGGSGVFASGYFKGNVDFGSTPRSTPFSDYSVVKLAP
jgi:hypothetical protein